MPYIAQSNIEAVFGAANVQVWSQLDPSLVTTDAARVASSINYAEATVEDRFRGGAYAIPFSGASYVLTDWCAKLAGVWLYESRGLRVEAGADNPMAGHRERVMEEIDTYVAGQRRLPLTPADSTPNSPSVVR